MAGYESEIPCIADVNFLVRAGPEGAGVANGARVEDGTGVTGGVGDGDELCVVAGMADVGEGVAAGALGAADVHAESATVTTKVARFLVVSRAFLFTVVLHGTR